MSKLKLYQMFHNKERWEMCSKDPNIIKICIGYEIGGYKDIKGDFVLANEGKYTMNQLVEYPAFYYANNHIADEEYMGFTICTYNTKVHTNFKPVERILTIDCDKIFKEEGCHIISFHPWQDIYTITNAHCPGMMDFIHTWLKEDMGLTDKDIEEIKEINKIKTMLYRNCFILPVKEYKEYFQFATRFVEYVDKRYDLYKYEINIPVPHRERGWSYYLERLICFWLMIKYGRNFKNKIF